MADVQIAVIDPEDTQLALAAPAEAVVNVAVPGVQGPIGLTGSVTIAQAGTAAEPGIRFESDTNTGIYSPGADQVAVSTGGSERLRITSAGLVGIGTSTVDPGHILQANGVIASVASFGAFSALQTAGGTGFRWTLANNGTFRLQQTTNGFSTVTTPLFVDSAGNVGIGTTSPSFLLDVAGSARLGAATGDVALEVGAGASANRNALIDLVGDTTYTDYGLRIIRGNSGANADSKIQHRGTGALVIEAQEAASTTFFNGGSERARIDSSGRLLVGTSSAAAGSTQTASIFGSTLIQSTGLQSLSSGATLDLNLLGNGVTGHLYVTSTLTSNAAIRTGETFFISTRLGDSTAITSLNSDNGSGGGSTFTVTNPSGNTFRFTDTSASACTVSMSFVGAICA